MKGHAIRFGRLGFQRRLGVRFVVVFEVYTGICCRDCLFGFCPEFEEDLRLFSCTAPEGRLGLVLFDSWGTVLFQFDQGVSA